MNAITHHMRERYFNPSALYAPAMEAERDMAHARKVIADSLQANEKNVIFTSGGTESDNLAIFGHLQAIHKPERVLYTAAEHAAVKNACVEAESRFGVRAEKISLTREGTIDLDALEAQLDEHISLICVMQVCNETGVIMPIDKVCALRDRLSPGAAIHVDGVQGYLRVPFSLRALNVQSYAMSAHKIHGPKGAGALVVRQGYRLHAQIAGGGQQNNLRSGTENTAGVAGLCAAVQSYPSDGMARMRELKVLLLSLLQAALPEITVVGLPSEHPMSAGHILSVAFPPVRAETLLHALEGDGICVGTGSACSSHKGKRSAVLTAMGLPSAVMDGAVRISLCPGNTEEEIRYTAEKIIAHIQMLRRFTRR